MTSGRGEHVQVIDRSVDLLQALSGGPRSLAEICPETGLSKATAFRLLSGLIARGFVMKNPAGSTYMLGPGLLRLGNGAIAGVGTHATVGRPALAELAKETGETVALHVRIGLERSSVDEIASQHSIRYTSIVGSVAPLHVGASGCILLAFMDDEPREHTLALLDASVPEFDRAELESRISLARRDGWSMNMGTRLIGASALSVPVRTDPLLLSLSVVGPSSRLDQETLEAFVPSMWRTADQLVSLMSPSMK